MCGHKVKTEDSYLPTCIFTFSSRKPFSLPVLILIQIGIILLVMILIWHQIGRTFVIYMLLTFDSCLLGHFPKRKSFG